MDQQRIKELIDLLGTSDLTELTLSEGGSTLHLSRQADKIAASPASAGAAQTVAASEAPAASTAPAPAEPLASSSTEVCSPLYGILHLTPSPEEPLFARIGDTVSVGQTLCIVEAMKMFHQVKANASGVLDALLAEAGTEVDSGQPLFRIVSGE